MFSKMQWVNPELLPWKRHSNLAILIVQTSAKYAPDTIAGNFLQDSVRHVSNLAGKLRKTPEQVFISWAWEMCSRLRLHRYDRAANDCIADIIDLDLDVEHLGEAAATKNPLAAFVALQTSQTGHLVEDVLERGLNQITLVLSSGTSFLCFFIYISFLCLLVMRIFPLCNQKPKVNFIFLRKFNMDQKLQAVFFPLAFIRVFSMEF